MMVSNDAIKVMLECPALARGQLLTASIKLAEALQEVNRMMGYLDRVSPYNVKDDAPASQYLGLGMKMVQRHLLHAVSALDMEPSSPSTPFAPRRGE